MVKGFTKFTARQADTKDKTCFKCGAKGVWFFEFVFNKDGGVCVCGGQCLRDLEKDKHPLCAGCEHPKADTENIHNPFNRDCGRGNDNNCGNKLFSKNPVTCIFHGGHPFFASRLRAPSPEEKKQTLVQSAGPRTQQPNTNTGQRSFADAIREPKPAQIVPQVPMSPEQKELDAKRREQEETNNQLRAKIEAKKQEKLARERFALEMQKLKEKEDELQAELARLEAELNTPNSSAP